MRWIIIFNTLTIIVGIASIIANIWIARYNAGKNRKIYGITTIPALGVDSINKELEKGDYTILYVGPPNQIGAIMYVLGKLNE